MHCYYSAWCWLKKPTTTPLVQFRNWSDSQIELATGSTTQLKARGCWYTSPLRHANSPTRVRSRVVFPLPFTPRIPENQTIISEHVTWMVKKSHSGRSGVFYIYERWTLNTKQVQAAKGDCNAIQASNTRLSSDVKIKLLHQGNRFVLATSCRNILTRGMPKVSQKYRWEMKLLFAEDHSQQQHLDIEVELLQSPKQLQISTWVARPAPIVMIRKGCLELLKVPFAAAKTKTKQWNKQPPKANPAT